MKTVHDPNYGRLIDRLRARRITLGLDQSSVASRLGYTDRWLSKVENRDIRLDILTFMRLCRTLGLRAHRLLQEAEDGLDEPAPPFFTYHGLLRRLHDLFSRFQNRLGMLNALDPVHQLIPRYDMEACHAAVTRGQRTWIKVPDRLGDS